MERLTGEEEDFRCDARLDQEPVEMDEGGCDVLSGLGAAEDSGSRVLDVLEPVQGFAGYQYRTPLQESRRDVIEA